MSDEKEKRELLIRIEKFSEEIQSAVKKVDLTNDATMRYFLATATAMAASIGYSRQDINNIIDELYKNYLDENASNSPEKNYISRTEVEGIHKSRH